MRRCFEPVNFLERRDLGIAGEPAQRDHVGRGIVLEDLHRLGDELVRQPCRLLRRRVLAVGRQRGDAGRLRVGVVDRVAEIVAAEHDDEAMLADRLDEDLRAGHLDLTQFSTHGDAAFVGRPAGPAVGDQALASTVQKLPRMATSRGPTAKLMPSASRMPRPMRYSRGS